MDTNRIHIGVSGGYNDQQLGVNKNSKSIKKSPTPQVYNIDKSDFRKLVQHLTGNPNSNLNHSSPSLTLDERSPSMHLQRIRSPPLSSFLHQRSNLALELQEKEDKLYMHSDHNQSVYTETAAAAAARESASVQSLKSPKLKSFLHH
ncbi:hypothetical protein ZOSMA_388G00080 [Zostera marina]|uniref:VQ domain-containing protein n=1 Tax=Zostera marina TaxID=29655 RepID=A0A0K9P4X3_ZOSMR|nr:hypothetical protein ZOSMA_388G00080 [Zostera marina]